MDVETRLYTNRLHAVYLPLRFHLRIPVHQEFQNARVGVPAAPIRTPFAYDLDHAHTRTHTDNQAYFPPMLNRLRSLDYVSAWTHVARGRYIDARCIRRASSLSGRLCR